MCLSHANVVLCVLCVACVNSCFVYNVLTHALVLHLYLQLKFSALIISCGWHFLITRVLWLVIIDLTLLIISDNSFLDSSCL